MCPEVKATESGEAKRTKAEEFFRRNDRNKDGQLSRDEFPSGLSRLFDSIDTDKNGLITLEEDITYRRNRSSRRQPNQRTTRQQQSGRSREVQLPAGAKVERDIVYARVGDRKLLLDLYLPAEGSAPLPVIVWVHGGGWRSGSKGSGGRARPMLGRGYAVVDVGYRLSGEAIFPAQVEDCKAAVRWVRANAAKYGLDPDRIGAWGRSAGGHLVAFLGTAGDVKEFDTEANAEYSSRVQAVCDWFGPTDFLQMDKHSLDGSRLIHDSPGSPESLLVGGPIQEKPYRSLAGKANPIKYVTKDDPPFLIMHGDKDMSVPLHQSELLYDALKKVGVDATLYVVKGGGHGLRGGEESSEILFEMAADFFDKHLKTQKPKVDSSEASEAQKKTELTPTYENVKYGPHERNVLDFYQAKSDTPAPVAVYIHGGGFSRGGKHWLHRYYSEVLDICLESGVSVAAIQYRFVEDAPLPEIFRDCARAIQFIRYNSDKWNIDKKRFAAFGASAGAGASMWLAFHDDISDPDNADPILRESSRITVVAARNCQSTYDREQWQEIVGKSPGGRRSESWKWYGLSGPDEIDNPKGKRIRAEVDLRNMITPDDAPVFLYCKYDKGEPTQSAQYVHHPRHSIAIKNKCDEVGIEVEMILKYERPEMNSKTVHEPMLKFLFRHLKVIYSTPAIDDARRRQ